MRTLPIGEPFKPRGSDGWTFVILERNVDVVLCEKTHPLVMHAAYEVAIVQRHDAYDIGKVHVEAGENLPGSEAFGRLAWAAVNIEMARAKFDAVIKAEAEKAAAKQSEKA